MADTLHMVTRERHTYKKWFRSRDFSFASVFNMTPVSAAEMIHMARAFPLAFVEIDGVQTLVALFSLRLGHNLFVAPDGRWLGGYVPAAVQHHPFSLGVKGDGNVALCVNESSGLVRDAAVGEEGFPFFGHDGKPTRETQDVADTLSKVRAGLQTARQAGAMLVEKKLLEPWPITAQEEAGNRKIDGVFRISEPALNAIGAEDLFALRNAGGLAVAYSQLFSMGNLAMLATLSNVRERAAKQRMAIPANSFISEDDGNLKIDWATFLKDD
ncbi:SapC family protein [Mesorhizobium sp. LHD-90]|uniref:SapC family protein n=1 Tax=Mesorhizobium sp. LHD-90 TaxID=3071414 RepID=UPI0027E17CEE|nr:SapC family protein [Mesorhizobium sp. LHD-90]MDQ6436151.1 SapC family protein [Mesorhizobium sp. LHD-90]